MERESEGFVRRWPDSALESVTGAEGFEVGACDADEGLGGVGEGGCGFVESAVGYGACGGRGEGGGGDGVVAGAHGGEDGQEVGEGEVDVGVVG